MTTKPDATDVRTTAEITDDGVIPPELQVYGDVPEDVVEALEAALDDAPNACDEPRVYAADAEELGRDNHSAEAVFICRFNEKPVLAPDGSLRGWAAPYRSREDLEATLFERGIEFEMFNSNVMGFY